MINNATLTQRQVAMLKIALLYAEANVDDVNEACENNNDQIKIENYTGDIFTEDEFETLRKLLT